MSKYNTMFVQYSQTTATLSYHSRHSYKVFKNMQSEGEDISKTLLNNCYLYDCKIFSCNMDNCDLQGTGFENCFFYNTSFIGADISSCTFRNCKFEKCMFDSTNILDCEFIFSTLYDCDFYTATVTNNIYKECLFELFNPTDTAIYASQFVKCKFIDSALLTAIYYSLFCACKLENTTVDSYILGFQFGLKQSQLKKCAIEHFGEQNYKYRVALKKIEKVYAERNMLIEKEILSFLKDGEREVKFERLICLVFEMINAGYVIKVDEVRFVRQIVNFIYRTNKISSHYFLCLSETLRHYDMSDYKSRLSDNVFNEITVLMHSLYSIRMELMADYKKLVNILKQNSDILPQIRYEIVYRKRPEYRLSTLMLEACNKKILPAYEKDGSFIEGFNLFWDNINEIAALVTLFGVGASVVKGVIKLISKLRKRKKAAQHEQVQSCEYESVKTVVEEECVTDIMTTQIRDFQNEIMSSTSEDHLIDESQQEATMMNITRIISVHKITITKEYSSKNIKKTLFK